MYALCISTNIWMSPLYAVIFAWLNKMDLWMVFISHTEDPGTKAAALHTCRHKVALCTSRMSALAPFSMCLVGIFHALCWMHAMLGMILIFSFCPGHWAFIQGVCGVCVCMWDCICAFMCVDPSAECVCVCVFTCPELINSCEHAGFRSICRSGHGAWIDPVAAVQASDWCSPY